MHLLFLLWTWRQYSPPRHGNLSTRLYGVSQITNSHNLNPFNARRCTLLRHCPLIWICLMLEKMSERSLPRCLSKFKDILFPGFSITEIKPSRCTDRSLAIIVFVQHSLSCLILKELSLFQIIHTYIYIYNVEWWNDS